MNHAASQSDSPRTPQTGRVAGIDYGTVRIGIAVADLQVRIATAVETYTRRTLDLDAQFFRRFATGEQIRQFIVGLPVHLSGYESQKSSEARAFGAWLAEQTGTPVVYFDERFTSFEAERILEAANLTKKKRQARIDALAAQILLTAYLESSGESESIAGLDE